MQVSTRKIVSIIFLLTLSGLILPSVSSTMTLAQTYPGGYTFFQLTVNSTIQNAGVVTPSSGQCYCGQIVNAYEYANPRSIICKRSYLNGIYEGKLSTIQITMTQDYILTAAFSRRQVALTITANPISGGITTPGIGVYNYSSGTTGYVQACVPKSLLLDASKLQVTLDGTTDQYTTYQVTMCGLLSSFIITAATPSL